MEARLAFDMSFCFLSQNDISRIIGLPPRVYFRFLSSHLPPFSCDARRRKHHARLLPLACRDEREEPHGQIIIEARNDVHHF